MNQDPSNSQPPHDLAAEQALLASAQVGDPEAFGDLFRLHQEKLTRYAISRVGPDEAEDLVQSVAERTWRNIKTFENRGSGIAPLLFRAAGNAAIDRYKSKHNTTYPQEPSELDYYLDIQLSPETEVIAKHSLEAAFAKLPDHHADLLRAIYVHGETLIEYGKRHDMPPGTRSSKHKRAKAALKKLIESGEVDLG